MAQIADTHRIERAALRPRPARRRLPGGRSEGALIARVGGGDDAAFDTLYDAYHRRLLAFCQHMLGSREEAEDVVQHTFLAAYRCLRAGYDVVALKPWLYTIARNRCVSVVRARREEIALEVRAPATEGLAAEVDRRADLRLLVRDVQRLPPDQRAALVLFEVGDHSHEEIAAVLGVRREKVKALVFQAREALMGWRTARETPCAHVREQLATLSGSALGRGTIRRHVEQCAGCADYEAAVRCQRAALAIALPVAPAAGLRAAVLGSALGGSAVGTAVGVGGTTSAAGGLAGFGAGGVADKVLVVAALAGGVGATGHVALGELQQRREAMSTPGQRVPPPIRAAPLTTVGGGSANPAAPASPATASTTAGSRATKATPTANGKARRGGRHARPKKTRNGKAASGKPANGKATTPGQLKAPRTPAQGKALGAGKVEARGAKPARVKPARPSVKPKPPEPKTLSASAPKAPKAPEAVPAAQTAPGQSAAQTAPEQSAAGPPGQARKQSDSAAKKP
jgi:RNA polymerase sigma factor (sigma-70 family)